MPMPRKHGGDAQRVTIIGPAALFSRLDAIARDKSYSRSEIIVEMLERMLASGEPVDLPEKPPTWRERHGYEPK